jgi:hypothetical protein
MWKNPRAGPKLFIYIRVANSGDVSPKKAVGNPVFTVLVLFKNEAAKHYFKNFKIENENFKI